MVLKIKIQRIKNGRKHTSHFVESKINMHLDIIEKLAEKATRLNVRPELIEEIYENGYIREDF